MSLHEGWQKVLIIQHSFPAYAGDSGTYVYVTYRRSRDGPQAILSSPLHMPWRYRQCSAIKCPTRLQFCRSLILFVISSWSSEACEGALVGAEVAPTNDVFVAVQASAATE